METYRPQPRIDEIIQQAPLETAAPPNALPPKPVRPAQRIKTVLLVVLLVLAWPFLSYVTSTLSTWYTEVQGASRFLQQEQRNKERALELLTGNVFPELTSERRRGPLSRELRDALLAKSYAEQVELLLKWFSLERYFKVLGVENKNHDWTSAQYPDTFLLLHYCPDAFPPQAELDRLPLPHPLTTETGFCLSSEQDFKQFVPQPPPSSLFAWQQKVEAGLVPLVAVPSRRPFASPRRYEVVPPQTAPTKRPIK